LTGEIFDAIDLDGEEGVAALAAARPEGGATLDGPVALTGREGGRHLLIAPTGVGNKAGLLDHVDIRGLGGYIVAPPSFHASGRQYQWALGRGLDDVPILPPPDWVIELWRPSPRSASPRSDRVNETGRRRIVAYSDTYGRRAFESAIANVVLAVEGTRNDTLNAAAFSFGQLIAGGVLDGGATFDALLLVGVRVGLPERECLATIESGLTAGARQPRSGPARSA
jgi:hypothetical protein